jgi:hypothetical protein
MTGESGGLITTRKMILSLGGNFEGLMWYGCDLSQSSYDWLGR